MADDDRVNAAVALALTIEVAVEEPVDEGKPLVVLLVLAEELELSVDVDELADCV